jgi:hypothetical protein
MILMNIYFRHYHDDFLQSLYKKLESSLNDDDMLTRIFTRILLLDPFESYQYCKGEIPKWMLFHMLDELFSLDYLREDENQEYLDISLRTFDYNSFFEYLMTLDVSMEIFLDYTTQYASYRKQEFLVLYPAMEKIFLKNLNRMFEDYKRNPNSETYNNMKNFIVYCENNFKIMIQVSNYFLNLLYKVKYLIKFILYF